MSARAVCVVVPALFVIDGLVRDIGILYAPELSFLAGPDLALQIVGIACSAVGLPILIGVGRKLAVRVYRRALPEREMMSTGVHRYVRHPFYLQFFLLPIGSVLLLVTVVGIPLGLSLLLALAFIYTLGYVVATVAVGNMILRNSSSRWVVFLVGWIVLRLLALIPVVGGLLWFLGSVWGLGLLAVAIHGRSTDTPATAPYRCSRRCRA